MTGFAALVRFLGRNWKLGLAAVLAIVVLVQQADLRRTRVERDGLIEFRDDMRETTSRAARIQYKGRPALLRLDQVGRQIVYLGVAVDRLRTSLAAKDAETTRRGEQLAQARAEAARADQDATRRFRAAASSIERLRAIAARPDDGRCAADPALLRELDDL